MSSTKRTTDHSEILRWAESQGAQPALVKDSTSHYDPGVLRIRVPGSDLGPRAEPLTWDAFFQKFDEEALALVLPEQTHEAVDHGQIKLVRREGYHRGL
jgi:hypothetical protein